MPLRPHISTPPRSAAARRQRGGFALLITITLLAFLVLLLVSLASLTRVETQVAANSQQSGQARQNALLALNIALGQLQKYAGPDQRITARADLENSPTTPFSHWTGVYGSAVAADYDQTPTAVAAGLTASANLAASGTGSPARLLSWLVSGNENDAFDPASHIGANGQITATATALRNGLRFSPSATVTGLTETSTVNSVLTIPDRDAAAIPATLLVGPGSVRSALVGAVPIDYVAAPLVNIDVPANSVPGLSGTTATTIGRYAWWVGDEGVKARLNLPLVTADADKPAAFASASRSAIELMDATNPAVPAPALNAIRIGTAYDPADGVDRILALSQMPISRDTSLSTTLKRRYHDLTTSSVGVLSDTYAGSLKRDLTALLAPGYAALPGSEEADGQPLHTNEATNTTLDGWAFTIPTWRHLRTYMADALPNTPTPLLVPRLPRYRTAASASDDDTGIFPVITYAALGFRFGESGGAVTFNLYPLVVLWNPYTTPMQGGTYEFGYGFKSSGNDNRIQLQKRSPAVPSGPPAGPWTIQETRDLKYAGQLLTTNIPNSTPPRYFRFEVQCPTIQPGESLIFTLPSNTTYDGTQVTPSPVQLTHGLNPYSYAAMPGTTIAAGEAGYDFQVTTSGNTSLAPMIADPATNTTLVSGRSLDNSSGGGVNFYLGEPRGSLPTNSTDEFWRPDLNQWYQAGQEIGHDGNVVANPIQGPGSLTIGLGTNPSLKTFALTVFSAVGSNYDANSTSNPRNLRWIAQSNLRAPFAMRTRRDRNYASSYTAQVGSDDNMWPTWFATNFPGDRASAGLSHDWDGPTDQPVSAALFEFPRQDRPLLSIGQLQHANISISGTYPAYAIGNAIADFRLGSLSEIASADLGQLGSEPAVPSTPRALQRAYHDISWLVNRTLWDRYYFSTVPRTGVPSTGTLPNRRHHIHDSTKDLLDPRQAAAGLMVEGTFNINSTSEQAWRAVLGGLNQLNYDVTGGNSPTAIQAAFPRFSRPLSRSTQVPTGTSMTIGNDLPDLWTGYRELNGDEIAQLARNIVEEIRARGPFVSLGDFINRRLIDNPGTPLDERLKGALQAAIDATIESSSTAFAANDVGNASYWGVARTVIGRPTGTNNLYNNEAARGITTTPSTPGAYQKSPAFAPKFITQADILSTIGASLSARSDTFVVRTYGEVRDPLDPSAPATSRAWCEAVVQRIPDYINTAESAESSPTGDNRLFGRQFKIISFQWLSPSDI